MAGLKFLSFVTLCWLLAAPVARAADPALGPHGGPMADTEPYNVELVLANGDIHVFAFDDKTRAPVSATTAHGTATVLIGDQKQTGRARAGRRTTICWPAISPALPMAVFASSSCCISPASRRSSRGSRFDRARGPAFRARLIDAFASRAGR